MKPWQRVIYNKYYVDEFYDAVIRKPLDAISNAFYKFFARGPRVIWIRLITSRSLSNATANR